MVVPGTVLGGRYRLEAPVGAGGMGQVWRATDQALGRVVAVKVMHPARLEEPAFTGRFQTEARMMASIDHPGVVAVHDYQQDAGGAFLVMSYVEGEPLSALLGRTGRLPAHHAMELIARTADALHAAHLKGVVHRDLKPTNLLIRPDGGVVLTDFGLARTQAGPQHTATGATVGAVSYLAPEQVVGDPESPRTDIYALGVMAYECLTGQRPFDRQDPYATAMARIREAPPMLPGDVPPAIGAVVARALVTDPAYRWESAAAFAAACRAAAAETAGWFTGPPGPQPFPPAYGPGMTPPFRRTSRWDTRLKVAAAGGVMGVALILVTGLVLAIAAVAGAFRDDPVPAPPRLA